MTTSTVKNLSGNYIINSTLVTINGNLVVTGNTTSVQSTNTIINDNIITLNGNVSPSTSPTLNAAIEVNRGSSANVQLRWNESYKQWQTTNDGATFGNIAAFTPGGVLIFYSATGNVQLTADASGGGGSGLYTTNDIYAGQELVTKTRAIAYSIIFG